jgi:4-alpha-glucanotransferase
MGDIPFGVSRYSADVWADQPLFDLDWSGGAPPESHFKGDPFTEKWGQNWGIPLYNWTAHEQGDYAWWRQRVVCTCEVFHSFRIDHVLGFFRVYSFPWIPERNAEFVELDETQTKSRCGGRLPGFVPRADEPEEFAILNEQEGEKLLRIILEAAGDSIVVAEDLGMVPDYVRPLLQRLGIPGFTIPSFERDEKDRSYSPARKFPAINLVTYATHDHSPLAQFYDDLVEHWTGPNGHEGWLEVCRLMEFLGKHGEDAPRTFTRELHLRLIEKLLLTPCWLAVFMITDLLGTHQRFNSPGSIGLTNWSERLEQSLDRYSASPQFGALIQRTAELIRLTQRSPRRSGS